MATFNFDEYTFLGKGSNNSCYYKDDVVAKVFKLNAEYSAETEAEQLEKANEVNSLAVKFLSLETFDNCKVIFMEKLTPLRKENFTSQERKEIITVFEQQLKDLHSQGIYHIDIRTPSGKFNNVILTKEGIRLIDWGRSHELEAYGKELVWNKEWEDFYDFSSWFLQEDITFEPFLDFEEDSISNDLNFLDEEVKTEDSVEDLLKKQFQDEEIGIRVYFVNLLPSLGSCPKDWYTFTNEEKANYIASLPLSVIEEGMKEERDFWNSLDNSFFEVA